MVKRKEMFVVERIRDGNFVLTVHARERMSERFISELDIIEVAKTLKSFQRQKLNDTYLLTGLDTWDELLSVSVAVRRNIIIVTVFFEA